MPVKNCVSNYAPIPNNTPVLSIRYGNNHCILPVVCKCDNHYLQYHARTYLSYQIRHGISGMVHAYGIDLDARRIKIPPASGSALLSTCHPVLYYSHALPSSGTLYADQVQHRKYRRLYLPIGWLAIFNFIISTILHLTGILDYIETLLCLMPSSFLRYLQCCSHLHWI